MYSILANCKIIFTIDDDVNCNQTMYAADFNGDDWMNFREFVVVALTIFQDESVDLDKAISANCSSCVGMENYNVKYVRLNLT